MCPVVLVRRGGSAPLPLWVRVKRYDAELRRVVPVSVEVRCAHCGSRDGELLEGSIHYYFWCERCREWTDLGVRAA